MSADEPQTTGVETRAEPNLAIGANITLGVNIKSPKMDYFLLTEDRLESLQGGAESLDLTFAGLAFGAFLTAIGIAIPMYVSGARGNIFLILCVLSPILLAASVYLGLKGWGIRNRFQTRLENLRKESKTVVTLDPK